MTAQQQEREARRGREEDAMGYDNPTPWRIGNRVRNGGTYILNSEGSAVAYIPHHKDALLIVEAVNGHDKEGSMQRKEAREVQEQG